MWEKEIIKPQEVVETTKTQTETQDGFQQIVINVKVEEAGKILAILESISRQLQDLNFNICRLKK